MTHSNFLNEVFNVFKNGDKNIPQHPSDSDIASGSSKNDNNELNHTSDMYDINDVVDSMSNMNVYSASRCSVDIHSRNWSLEPSEASPTHMSNIPSGSDTPLNTSGFISNSNESEYSITRTSSSLRDALSSIRSNLDDSQRNTIHTSLSYDDSDSRLVSRSSSRKSKSASRNNSPCSYYREPDSPVHQKSLTGFKLPQEFYLTSHPVNFDIFTPNTMSESKFNDLSPEDHLFNANSSIEDYATNYYKDPVHTNSLKNNKYNENKNVKSTGVFNEDNESYEQFDNKSLESNDNESCGMYDVNMSDSEDSNSYVPGGYHPVSIGEVYNGRYKVEAKLGWGYFSTVWLASDLSSSPDTFVALKFQRSAKMYTYAVFDEIDMLNAVNDREKTNEWVSTSTSYSKLLEHNYNPSNGVVSYLDNFTVEGPNGSHVCVVFEVMGPNILTLIKLYKFQGIPLNLVKKITTHVLLGLDYLHRVCKIIHTDIKPENILITSPLNLYKEHLSKNQGLKKTDSTQSISSVSKGHVSNKYANGDNRDNMNNSKEDKNNNRDNNNKRKENDMIYIKNTIRPCFSDPSLITSYDDNYALQETLMRRPYHHITWNMMKTVDRNVNKTYYHPSILSSIGINPLGINRTRIKTTRGYVQLKPYTLEQFHDPHTIYKICDLGNACWLNKHFTDEIQTRQYRSPEAILNIGYDNLADIWSLACMIFELVTGDYLFDPNGKESIQRDSNHLQLIVELLGPIPNYMIQNSKKAKKISFYQINKTKRWPLESVLVKKYKMDKKEANGLANFLSCMLRINPYERHTAQTLLSHKWLTST